MNERIYIVNNSAIEKYLVIVNTQYNNLQFKTKFVNFTDIRKFLLFKYF